MKRAECPSVTNQLNGHPELSNRISSSLSFLAAPLSECCAFELPLPPPSLYSRRASAASGEKFIAGAAVESVRYRAGEKFSFKNLALFQPIQCINLTLTGFNLE